MNVKCPNCETTLTENGISDAIYTCGNCGNKFRNGENKYDESEIPPSQVILDEYEQKKSISETNQPQLNPDKKRVNERRKIFALVIIFIIFILSISVGVYNVTNQYINDTTSIPNYTSKNSIDNTNYSNNTDSYNYSNIDMESTDYSMSNYDSNGDGRISWSEWVAWCEYDSATYGYSYDDYDRDDFNRYDSDNNGYLDRTELTTYYSNL
ncbi:hypothetical protein KQY27_03235 [Methanobrevibacter sp. TMH8]|uniref:hypothetical protein n=1 Tax=Methanobrevibacter sp. TMH8 TaxID=2848611 RepID=UPI001CC9720C|nr:hypothetical protein [Methanobrevibacter sp. TMH8]MBZ9570558.1 hypothetical protein [Methanobrevibacter sp. TMH8]